MGLASFIRAASWLATQGPSDLHRDAAPDACSVTRVLAAPAEAADRALSGYRAVRTDAPRDSLGKEALLELTEPQICAK